MPKRTPPTLAALAIVIAMVFASPASAASFEPGPGSYTVDTSTLTLTGPATNIEGTNQNGVAVFSFDTVSIPSTATITVEGSRPLEFIASGEVALAGLIDGRGTDASDFTPNANKGGPGGGAGGTNATLSGGGPGGGGGATSAGGAGGGGGFGGKGAAGGTFPGSGGLGGPAYGDLEAALMGGSGGGGGDTVGGGGGGGAIALFGSSIRIVPTGEVLVDGGGGAVGAGAASGGGSGGAIVVHGDALQLDGVLSARGGDGGEGGCCAAGGGGGGGRIALQYKTLSMTGLIDVSGGISGARSSSGFLGAGTIGEPAGYTGVFTKALIPTPSAASTASNPSVTPTASPAASKLSCVVPKLKGKKIGPARKALKRANCSLGKIKKGFSVSVKKGRVIASRPGARKVLADGAKVGVTVSKGKKP